MNYRNYLLHSCWCIAFGCWNSNSSLNSSASALFKIIQIFYSFLPQPFPFRPIFGLRPSSQKSAGAPPSFRLSSLAPQQPTVVGLAAAHQLTQPAAASPFPRSPAP
jgi:hypothetical protein